MKTGDYAYLPGTGPSDKYCQDCFFLEGRKCHKAAQLRRVSQFKLEPINRLSVACKYFEAKAA